MKTLLLLILLTGFVGNMAFAQTKAKKIQPTKPSSVTTKPPVTVEPGAAIYTQYCLTCHQADGGGVPKLNPSLRGSSWVSGDKNRLISVLLKGLANATIDDEEYDNAMPAHDFLTDQQIADVLTYIRYNFTNKADPIRPQDVAGLR